MDWYEMASAVQILMVVSGPFSDAVVAKMFTPFLLQCAYKSH
jgi:hypothetical protein